MENNNNKLSIKSKNSVYMTITGSFKAKLCCLYNKKTLTFVSLLLIVTLISSPLISVGNGSPAVFDAVIKNEAELLNAISTAPNKKSHVIGLSENITLNNSLEIPKNKNITLALFGNALGFVSLIGCNGMDTIIVKSGGMLVLLDGIVITHMKDDSGRGVYIEKKGVFILAGGEISGNTINTHGVGVYNHGAGVYNQGTFKLSYGRISNNTASGGYYGLDYGGGVYNMGSFVMSGGVIYDNTASMHGGGVYNSDAGFFVMSGGEITCNTAFRGGGVQYSSGRVRGTFTLSGGKIFNNTATNGSGYHDDLCEVSVDGVPFFIFFIWFIVIAVFVVIGVLLVYRLEK